MNLDRQIQWLSHHLPVVYTSGVFLLIGICVFTFLSNQSFILIEVSDTNKANLTTYISTDSGTEKSNKPTGLLLVSRKTKSIIMTKSDYVKTQVDIDFPWYGFTSKKITFQEDQNATKVAYKSTTGAECMTHSKELDSLSYYDCRNPKAILKYNTPKDKSWSASIVARVYYANGKATPYMGGVIGIADFSESKTASSRYSIVYTKPNGKILTYNIPESLVTSSSMQNIQIFTDTNNSENSRFAIVDRSGTIFLGTPQGSNVTYATIDKPAKYTQNNNTLCSIHDTDITCYRGQAPIGDVEEGVASVEMANYSIVTSNFDGSNVSSHEIKNFDESIDSFVNADGTFYGKAYKKLFVFERKNDYKPKELAQNVDFIAENTKLYYIQNNSIYTYDNTTKSAHQVFHSPLVQPRSLLGTDGNLYFTARTTQEKTITYAYKLENSKNTTERLIDILPARIDGVYSMDLVNNRLSVTFNGVTRLSETRQIVDQNKLLAAKNDFISKIIASGIDPDTIQLEFLY